MSILHDLTKRVTSALQVSSQGLPSSECIRGSVLLQAGLLRRGSGGASSLSAEIPGQRDRDQPESVQSFSSVRRKRRAIGDEAAYREDIEFLQFRPRSHTPQHSRVYRILRSASSVSYFNFSISIPVCVCRCSKMARTPCRFCRTWWT